MTAKQAVVEFINSAPDDIGWQEIQEELYVRWRIEQSLEEEPRGELFTTEEVLEHLTQCRKSTG